MDNLFIIKDENDIKDLENKFKEYFVHLKKETYLFVDVSKINYNMNLNFFLNKQETELNLNYFCLNQLDYKKIIKINVHHEIEKTYSYVKYHGIGMQKSLTNLTFLSINDIRPLANIYSEQEIKEIIMDESKFSGIPQIDAANNSFTSAHKLMVGSVSKEELFYLMSLGINHLESINILIETLYKSFFISIDEVEQEKLDILLKKEIKDATTKKL